MPQSQIPFRRPSSVERFFNQLFGILVGWGFGLSHNYLLQVQGRKTGRMYSTPVNVLDHNGRQFLVAPRGETQWVRNARAGGQVWLKKGRTCERFELRPLSDTEKPEILKEYVNRFKTTVQQYFSVPAGAPIEAFEGIAQRYPAFEIAPLKKRGGS